MLADFMPHNWLIFESWAFQLAKAPSLKHLVLPRKDRIDSGETSPFRLFPHLLGILHSYLPDIETLEISLPYRTLWGHTLNKLSMFSKLHTIIIPNILSVPPELDATPEHFHATTVHYADILQQPWFNRDLCLQGFVNGVQQKCPRLENILFVSPFDNIATDHPTVERRSGAMKENVEVIWFEKHKQDDALGFRAPDVKADVKLWRDNRPHEYIAYRQLLGLDNSAISRSRHPVWQAELLESYRTGRSRGQITSMQAQEPKWRHP